MTHCSRRKECSCLRMGVVLGWRGASKQPDEYRIKFKFNFKDISSKTNKIKTALKHFLHTHLFYNLDEFLNNQQYLTVILFISSCLYTLYCYIKHLCSSSFSVVLLTSINFKILYQFVYIYLAYMCVCVLFCNLYLSLICNFVIICVYYAV